MVVGMEGSSPQPDIDARVRLELLFHLAELERELAIHGYRTGAIDLTDE